MVLGDGNNQWTRQRWGVEVGSLEAGSRLPDRSRCALSGDQSSCGSDWPPFRRSGYWAWRAPDIQPIDHR